MWSSLLLSTILEYGEKQNKTKENNNKKKKHTKQRTHNNNRLITRKLSTICPLFILMHKKALSLHTAMTVTFYLKCMPLVFNLDVITAFEIWCKYYCHSHALLADQISLKCDAYSEETSPHQPWRYMKYLGNTLPQATVFFNIHMQEHVPEFPLSAGFVPRIISGNF